MYRVYRVYGVYGVYGFFLGLGGISGEGLFWAQDGFGVFMAFGGLRAVGYGKSRVCLLHVVRRPDFPPQTLNPINPKPLNPKPLNTLHSKPLQPYNPIINPEP